MEIKPNLFNIDRERIKNNWLRSSQSLLETVSYLEKELAKAKKNKAPESVIMALDSNVDNLIMFYNKSNEYLNLMENELVIQRLNTKLNEQIFKEIIFSK